MTLNAKCGFTCEDIGHFLFNCPKGKNIEIPRNQRKAQNPKDKT